MTEHWLLLDPSIDLEKLSPEVEEELREVAMGFDMTDRALDALRAQRIAGRVDTRLNAVLILPSMLRELQDEILALRAQVETLTQKRDEALAKVQRLNDSLSKR
jgi:hypothetical protein